MIYKCIYKAATQKYSVLSSLCETKSLFFSLVLKVLIHGEKVKLIYSYFNFFLFEKFIIVFQDDEVPCS